MSDKVPRATVVRIVNGAYCLIEYGPDNAQGEATIARLMTIHINEDIRDALERFGRQGE